jgi:hypothetical protein
VSYLSEKVDVLFKLGSEMGIPFVGQNYGQKENTIYFRKKKKIFKASAPSSEKSSCVNRHDPFLEIWEGKYVFA